MKRIIAVAALGREIGRRCATLQETPMSSPISARAHSPSLAAVEERPGRKEGGNAVAQSHAALVAKQKANFNSAIVESSLSVSIESGNQPLALLYRSAIDRLNEIL